LQGLASDGKFLMAIDQVRGYLLQINPHNSDTTILNPEHVAKFIGGTGLALWEDTVWITRERQVLRYSLSDLTLQPVLTLPFEADGVAIWQSTLYVTCKKAGYIFVYSALTGQPITRFCAPGVGIENITIRGEELWICDRTEQTVYCLDRATGALQFSVLTPFECPSGLTFHPHPQTGATTLYVAYASEEAYVRDNPNADPPHELTYRDRTFIHPLYFHYNRAGHYALSNGYLLEMSYVEEISPLDEVLLTDVEWRMALPAQTHRQRVRQVEAIGLPFTEEIQDGQRVAVFRFDTLKPHEGRVFGWKALIEVWGIKYQLTYDEVERIPELSPELRQRYLVDDDQLAMDTEVIRRAARLAVGSETNILRQILRIRNTVYDRLTYSIRPAIDTPDVVWERETGSCGEYVGVLLALSRLNGIACRTVGRYKCPRSGDRWFAPLQPDFNHVWLEFYVPGFGWLPMESNPDDTDDGGPYPTRFFMGLPWYHAEAGKGIPFETVRSQGKRLSEIIPDLSIGNLALNHIRFRVLDELQPTSLA
jgi:transglutaminase-like putative cysteine protease